MIESSGPGPRPGPLRRALARRDYRLILGADAVSSIGDWFYSVGLIVYVFDLTGSAAWVAAVGVARLLPKPLLGSFAGVLADRYDRRALMLASDVARTVVMTALAVAAFLGTGPLVAVGLAALSTALGTPFGPAQQSLIPDIVPEDELASANSVDAAVENVALLVGPGLGGLVLLATSPAVAFAANAATFAVSAVLVLAVRYRPTRTADRAEPASMLRELRDGVAALRSSAQLLVIVVVAAVSAFQFGMESVLWVSLSEERFGLGAEGVGFLFAVAGAGGLLAAAVTSRLTDAARPDRIVLLAALAYGLPFSALGVIRDPWVASAAVAVEGMATIVFDVVVLTLLQRLVTAEVRGRVLGLFDSIIFGASMIGLLLAPALVALFGLTAATIVGGLALPLAALAGLPVLARAARAAQRRRAELAPRVSRLATLGILDGAGPAAFEAVAADLTDVGVRAGDAVVTEGEPADAVYLVVDGTFDVRSRGEAAGAQRLVARLGPGDHFGEIGVLHETARTASVVATSDGALLRIEGSAFADAVARTPAVPRPLRELMQARLARTHPARAARTAGGTDTDR